MRNMVRNARRFFDTVYMTFNKKKFLGKTIKCPHVCVWCKFHNDCLEEYYEYKNK